MLAPKNDQYYEYTKNDVLDEALIGIHWDRITETATIGHFIIDPAIPSEERQKCPHQE